MSTVVISYSRTNEAVVRTLASDIEALGHRVWFDRDLTGGQAWWERILETVRACEAFIFALAPEALESTACEREYHYAAALGKPILPVLVADGVSTHLLPPALSQIQFVDYRKQDRPAAFRLARALNELPHPKPLPDPLPDPPAVPVSYLGSLAEKVGTSSLLTSDEQSALVLELKRACRDPETVDDGRQLLGKLRTRDDLLARIAEEIEEILAMKPAAVEPLSLPPDPPVRATEPASKATAPGEPPTAEPGKSRTRRRDREAASEPRIRSFAALFDRERYGIDVYVGVGYLVTLLLVSFLRASLEVPLTFPGLYRGPFYFVVDAAAFALICHLVRKDWLLPVCFGALFVVEGASRGLIMGYDPFLPADILSDFLTGGALMVGLVLAVRLLGPRLWSFMLGGALSTLCSMFINFFLGYHRGAAVASLILESLTVGALWAALVYAGLALHLRQKGFRISNARILARVPSRAA